MDTVSDGNFAAVVVTCEGGQHLTVGVQDFAHDVRVLDGVVLRPVAVQHLVGEHDGRSIACGEIGGEQSGAVSLDVIKRFSSLFPQMMPSSACARRIRPDATLSASQPVTASSVSGGSIFSTRDSMSVIGMR